MKGVNPVSVRTALRLELANRPGELAKALRPIAQAGVNALLQKVK